MCLHHFLLHCITALIMWVKVSHSKWVGPDQKQGETRLPEVLHHKWPSNPAGSLRHRRHRAYITALRKRDRHSKNRMMMKHFIDPCRDVFLFAWRRLEFTQEQVVFDHQTAANTSVFFCQLLRLHQILKVTLTSHQLTFVANIYY